MSDPVGGYYEGGVVADRDREAMLLVRPGTAACVKLDIQMLGVNGLPDGDKKYIFHRIAHYQWIHRRLFTRHCGRLSFLDSAPPLNHDNHQPAMST